MIRFLVLPLLLLSACAAPRSVIKMGASPRFDWFEYAGSDSVFDLPVGPDDFRNPILAGFYPDPSIVRVEQDYFLVNSSFAYFPGVPIFRSRDLVNWTQIGHVLDRPSQLPLTGLRISEGIFAPALSYHDGVLYMITTLVGAGGNFYVTARDPAGPWSEPVWLPGVDGIDPSFFFDDDGKAYVVNNGPPEGAPQYDGHRAIWIQEFDLKTGGLVGPRSVLVDKGSRPEENPIWIEGPHLYKLKGRYFLMAAEGGTGPGHSEVIFRSDAATGPYTPYGGNPVLTQRQLDPARPFAVTSTGHADLVDTPSGELWAVFLGTRPYRDDLYNTGRETFLLPVSWKDGWPVILEGNKPVPPVAERPHLDFGPVPPVPTTGNFTLREGFDGRTLPLYWNLIRTPEALPYSLDANPGALTLYPRPVALEDGGQPAFVGRRQAHGVATATTQMRYRPREEGPRAGLAAFQNEGHFFTLTVARQDGRQVVQVQQAAGGAPTVLASAAIGAADTLRLRIEADGGTYRFLYDTGEDDWRRLATADGTILSTNRAGGFVGTYFGLYAYAPDAP